MSQKVFIFCQNVAGKEFSPTANFRRLYTRFLKGLYNPYLQSHYQVGSWGKNLEENHQEGLIFLREMVYQLPKYNARTKYSAFWFRRKCLSFRNIQKNWQNFFGFWLISFYSPKPGFSHIFAGGKWKRRRRKTFADLKNQIWKAIDTAICGKSLRFFRW